MDKNNEAIEITDEETGEITTINSESLVGSIRDHLLRSVKQNGMKKSWDKMSEAEQTEEIEHATDLALQLVRCAVNIVVKGKHDIVHAIIEKFTIKDGKVQITAGGIAEDRSLLALNHAGEKAAKIIITNVEQFDQERSNIEPDKDEPEMFEDEGDEDEQPEQPPEPEFDNEAEQAEGREVLDSVGEPNAETGEEITPDNNQSAYNSQQ